MNKIIYLLLLSCPSLLLAADLNGNLRVQPIIGLERVQKLSPTPHTKTRTVYGARVLYGLPLLSLEAEVTQANDSESFPDNDLTIKDDSTAAKLGIRSDINLVLFRWYLRAGGHARKSKLTKTTGGVTTVTEPAIKVSPYAGTGFTINLLGKFFANGGIDVIFTGEPKGSDKEYQTTLGFGVRI